jgi:hypothetical protein
MARNPREWTPRVSRQRIPLSAEEQRQRRIGREEDKVAPRPFNTRYTLNHDESFSGDRYGPFSKTRTRYLWGTPDSERVSHKYQQWYRWKRKGSKTPNPYVMFSSVRDPISTEGVGDCVNSWSGYYGYSGYGPYDSVAIEKARQAFISSMKERTSASLAVTIAEWRQSHDAIVHRGGQLLDAIKSLKEGRRGNFEGILKKNLPESQRIRMAKKFRDIPDRKWRGPTKDLSGLWLEYHFGWAPLVDDIQNAVKVLGSNPPSQLVVGRGRHFVHRNDVRGNYQWSENSNYSVKARVQAFVTISNANLAQANQMGLLNPASVAWELVPFSFIVDWFIPIGKFLESWTDTLGFDLQQPFTTVLRELDNVNVYKQPSSPYISAASSVCMVRSAGFPLPKLIRPPFKGLSVSRGASAIALIIQGFLSIKR